MFIVLSMATDAFGINGLELTLDVAILTLRFPMLSKEREIGHLIVVKIGQFAASVMAGKTVIPHIGAMLRREGLLALNMAFDADFLVEAKKGSRMTLLAIQGRAVEVLAVFGQCEAYCVYFVGEIGHVQPGQRCFATSVLSVTGFAISRFTQAPVKPILARDCLSNVRVASHATVCHAFTSPKGGMATSALVLEIGVALKAL